MARPDPPGTAEVHEFRIEDAVNERCPWSGNAVKADSLMAYRGRVVGFCNPGCRDKFATAVRQLDEAIDGKTDDG